ncbi:DUF5333 domain-containing protein [Rhodovulum adriaticum]|uniref:DUF5333 domain-containing protein n=1 Tax=Rhodovulum adriaticum TaxID=35804 RepID=A0A4V2SM79_RHOAD|nr:DUF5333 domain-containing protein [Rhodovulum adriaticum]MBK1635728.1 hypothetical protein [Rhodovulum adriaticum]TCP26236.1 hypothetical protein EV656_102199 [Rhodovulum adriaticum]
MRRPIRHIAGAVLATLLGAGAGPAAASQDLPPLTENDHVWNSLLSASVGDAIQRKCPTISPRLFRAFRAAKDLERHALSLGYNPAQIEAFLDSSANKARMKAERDAYLAANGVSKDDPESYCRLGREEIARNTLTGSLLRETR